MKTLKEAKEIFSGTWNARRTEAVVVPTEKCLGMVSAEPVFAIISAPSYHSAAMDGIAVRAEETYSATDRNPISLKLGDHAIWINTGHAIPEGYNAVIMIEKIHQLDDETLEILSPAYPWQNIRKVGEDIVATQLILPQNHAIRPYDLAALVSAGVFSVKVRKRPRVVIIPTGSELVSHKAIESPYGLKDNQIIESNSIMLSGLIRECNSIPIVYDIVSDVEMDIRKAIITAVDSGADLVLINAGSSAGSKDYTAHVIGEMGEVLVHGVAMMPGKPTILGLIKGTPVIGNPGYAVSAALSFDQFVKPLLFGIQGMSAPVPVTIDVKPSRDIPSKLGVEEFLRVNIGRVGDTVVATPLPRSAGSITTLTRAEGILRISDLSEGVGRDEVVKAELLVDEKELDNTIVIIGSHDMTIDIIADEIRRRGRDIRVSSGNVGSLGGLMALKKGVCHIAGSHLLDTESGEYNISYIKKYLKGMKVKVFNLVLRDQGLIIARGNPKKIQGLKDLAKEGIIFINRQAGSGTRVLFDYKLEEQGIKSSLIKGYDNEEFTHMAVAVDVLSGTADCGMGIFAAAKALGLDFIPIVQEQYDLIIPERMLENINIQEILDTVSTNEFRERVKALGGYDPSESGRLFMEVG
jgi:putative molybdopterin biosynthesis protein